MPAKADDSQKSVNEPSPFESLTRTETRWAHYQPWLKSIGYVLRARYQPGWKPSWLTSGLPEEQSEDSLVKGYTALVLDATLESTKQHVALKLVPTHTRELPIWQYLSSPEKLTDTRNHCVPILAVHPLPDTDDHVLLVMPLLLYYDIPRFETVGEILSCVYHLIQGLAYLHEHNVAHLDICGQNILQDPGTKFFPKGFHPVRPTVCVPDPNSPKLAPSPDRSSRTLANVKYYFIDFGESVMFESEGDRHHITGSVGHHLDIPDFANGNSYDPFCLDIRALAETFYSGPLKRYSGLDILNPLISSMRHDDPSQRPTATEALSHIFNVIKSETAASLRQPLQDRADSLKSVHPGVRERIFEARIKRIHPMQPPIPELAVDELEPVPLRLRLWNGIRHIF
ncbi:hypothetical protein SISSUDRAFT_1057728 [Sistotremastrum suecicum HHB10207 ss-3]|uniref:Protein kinase domain-containing protein n=1 Tax=Sistotremastrum suecicum HHB10207 ss-3 TaxID=1314776 RepID=A0A166I2A6_9AGAM|nr:hypothetical protein SISSUDRAFT_1057728 [Sistotremastrum suecicum HHB10207 ss-3]